LTAYRVLAATLAVAVLLLNFALEHIAAGLRGTAVLIPGLLEFKPAWNRGVSFSLFWQDDERGRYILIAVLASVVALVGFFAWRSTDRLQAAGYGLVMGGALGNLADRSLDGAVFDYLFLHMGRISLFVVNFPDFAITAGVLLLVMSQLQSSKVNVPYS
jgi:signal peptidase II